MERRRRRVATTPQWEKAERKASPLMPRGFALSDPRISLPPPTHVARALEGNASFLFVRDNERATISDPSSLGQKAAAAEERREEAEAENLFLLFTPSARCCWTAIYKGLQCIPFVRTTCTIRSFSILVQCSGGPNSRASSVSPKARRTVAKFASPTLPVMHRSCSKGCTMIPESGSGTSRPPLSA